MTIRFDSLLVRALADELATRYGGQRVRSVRLEPAGQVVIAMERAEALQIRLSRRTCSLSRVTGRMASARGVVPAGHRIASITAPADERLLLWTFSAGNAPPLHLVIELQAQRHNAFLMGEDRRIRAAVFGVARGRSSRAAGTVWSPPPPVQRAGLDAPIDEAVFRALLAPVAPASRPDALIRAVAWTSTINAEALLGGACASDDPALLAEAYRSYLRILWKGPVAPCLLASGRTRQPYPFPLPDRPFEPMPDLLTAFESVQPDIPPEASAAAIAHWREKRERTEARIARLRQEAMDAPAHAADLRHQAGLLLAHLDRIPRGARSVELDDFAGGRATITLDPGVRPADQATRLFDEAKRRERAAARVPALLRKAEEERRRFAALETRAAEGEPGLEPPAAPRPAGGRRALAGPLPYRRYRTTGGFEVRVGRGARANDDLTFHHSSPDDIWLHARDAGGAHVVLRWPARDANPPASDLREAAILAALHSRARTSGTVPVDWTRRKYVRKPRKAPPGLVTVERARTLFVAPDPDVADRLRDHDALEEDGPPTEDPPARGRRA